MCSAGEEIEITFSYWDGSGHRRTVKVSSRAQWPLGSEEELLDFAVSLHTPPGSGGRLGEADGLNRSPWRALPQGFCIATEPLA